MKYLFIIFLLVIIYTVPEFGFWVKPIFIGIGVGVVAQWVYK